MIPALKAEYRKFTTVRSTYFVTVGALALTALFAGYVFGFRSDAGVASERLAQAVLTGINLSSLFAAIVCILQVSHEYRHHTILYTLTAAASRSKVFVAKLAVTLGYLILFAAIAGIVAGAAAFVGAALSGAPLGDQAIGWWDLVWRSLSGLSLYGLLAFGLAILFRSVAVPLAILLIGGDLVEQLLSLVLKDKAAYLPFTALGSIITSGGMAGGGVLSPRTALWVASLYVAGLLVVAWLLFVRRDAD